MSFGWCYDSVGPRCAKGETPGARNLWNACKRKWPALRFTGIYNCRPNSGGSGLSTHAEGRGIDLGTTNRLLGDQIAAILVKLAQTLGIQRVIWNRREWDSKERVWEAYTGESPHTDHLHVELCRASARTLSYAACEAALFPPEVDDVTPEQAKAAAKAALYEPIPEFDNLSVIGVLDQMAAKMGKFGLDFGRIKVALGIDE